LIEALVSDVWDRAFGAFDGSGRVVVLIRSLLADQELAFGARDEAHAQRQDALGGCEVPRAER
jgi:hypothetical protein